MAKINSVSAYEKILRKIAKKAVEEVIVEAYDSLTDKSPVDTGLFRANWNISSNEPDETVERTTNRMVNTSDVRNAARAAMNSSAPIFITNGLPYARRLEYGHSQKSQGMLRRTAQKLKLRNKM